MKRRLNGEGTVFEETDPRRKTTHRAQMQVQLPDGSVRRVVARGHSKTDALQKVRKKAERAAEVMPGADRLTLAAYLERWLEHKSSSVRASTLYAYRNDVANITRHLGGAKVGRIRAFDVQTMLDRLRKEKRNREGGAAKADKARRTLKQAMSQAVRWGIIARSPLDQLEPLRKAVPKRHAWGADEIRKFLDAVQAGQRPDTYYPLFVAAIFTGARIGELLALQWGDVHEDHIVIRRSWSRHAVDQEEAPKTRAGERTIPISAFVRKALGKRGEPHELVFHGQRGTRIRPENVRKSLRHFATKAEIPPIKVHELRRTYATTLARLGHHPSVIQALLGHATPTLALTVYTDVLEEQRQAARLEPDAVMSGAKNGADAIRTPASQGDHEGDSITPSQADQDSADAAPDESAEYAEENS